MTRRRRGGRVAGRGRDEHGESLGDTLLEAMAAVVAHRGGEASLPSRIAPEKPASDANSRRKLLEEVRAASREKASAGPSAARSQDFLYGDDGTPP